MKILAIDTSSSACSVALMLGEEIKVLHEMAPMQQAQRILPMIEKILTENNMTLKQLDALAFGCGPGSFTGIRIAASVIQGLSFAASLPVIPVSSLAALAQTAYMQNQWRKILIAVDARMHEIYWGAYEGGEKGLVELIGEEGLYHPKELPLPSEIAAWHAAGNAWDIYRLEIPFMPKNHDITLVPRADAIALLAKDKERHPPGKALPIYLRDQVAVKQIKR